MKIQRKQCPKNDYESEKCKSKEGDRCKLLQMNCREARIGETKKRKHKIHRGNHKQLNLFEETKNEGNLSEPEEYWEGM